MKLVLISNLFLLIALLSACTVPGPGPMPAGPDDNGSVADDGSGDGGDILPPLVNVSDDSVNISDTSVNLSNQSLNTSGIFDDDGNGEGDANHSDSDGLSSSSQQVSLEEYPSLGNSSFQIVYLGDFSRELDSRVNFAQVAALRRDYVVSNRATLIFQPVYSTEDGKLASQAAFCMWEQGSKQYWSYHDTLFRFFARLDNASLHNYVGRVPNVNKTAFTDCLSSGKYVLEVERSRQSASASSNQTPLFLVEDKLLIGNVEYKTLQAEIERQMGNS